MNQPAIDFHLQAVKMGKEHEVQHCSMVGWLNAMRVEPDYDTYTLYCRQLGIVPCGKEVWDAQ